MNPYTNDYVHHHQDALLRDASEHRPAHAVRRRGSPDRTGPRVALARLLVGLGVRLTPSRIGFAVGERATVRPAPARTPAPRGPAASPC